MIKTFLYLNGINILVENRLQQWPGFFQWGGYVTNLNLKKYEFMSTSQNSLAEVINWSLPIFVDVQFNY